LNQARAIFQAEVNDIVLQAVGNYWNVVLARESLTVQRKSYEEAQKSYDHDKKALSLGALPPLDIYRSEAQVASRRVGVIQAEYALKQAEDQFRQVVGADLDAAIRVLDLELTDQPEPLGTLPSTDIPSTLARALANRPELAATQQQLASDELSIRLAHNSLKPDLELSGFYSGNGVAGDRFNTAVPPQLIKSGLGDSLSQSFHFTYPAYGASLSLTLPIKNHNAEANLADADSSAAPTRALLLKSVTPSMHLNKPRFPWKLQKSLWISRSSHFVLMNASTNWERRRSFLFLTRKRN
jgi:outer membrane protein TolC